jgi:quercetin dioxygenase-like cupin family protein
MFRGHGTKRDRNLITGTRIKPNLKLLRSGGSLSLLDDTMYIVNLDEGAAYEPLTKQGAQHAKVKHLISKNVGAEKFYLRYYSVEKGGHTPLDRHAGEHEVFVMKGRAHLKGGERREYDVKPGDAIFIRSNEIHQFINSGNEPFEFLSVRGADELYPALEYDNGHRVQL